MPAALETPQHYFCPHHFLRTFPETKAELTGINNAVPLMYQKAPETGTVKSWTHFLAHYRC
jgi:hypothetical protein